jgi:predicted ATPase
MSNANKYVNFTPDISEFISNRRDSFYTTLSGSNNSGKSLILKNIKTVLGRPAYMAGPQRFYHVFELATQRFNTSDYDNWNHNFASQFYNEEHNFEQNTIDLGRIISALKDTKRKALFEICGSMIAANFSLQRRDQENEMSPRYVDMDGQNLAVASSGTRLLMTLIGLCLDEEFEFLLIDEPELGLSPRLQAQLSKFFSDRDQRSKYFPHLKGIFVATHSHLMLDKVNITNNFVITKSKSDVNIRKIATISDLHQLQFNMLGNSLEDLFLPVAIVICEGKTDKPFIEKVLELRHPGRRILVIESQGDVKRIFKNLCTSLGDIKKSPFRDRTFIILDSVHTQGTKAELISMGAVDDNVIIWDKNGIEYIYPPILVSQAFSCDQNQVLNMKILSDNVTIGSITLRKTELAEVIIRNLNSSTLHSPQFEEKLLKPISTSIG